MQWHATNPMSPPYYTATSSNTFMMKVSSSPKPRISTFKVVFKRIGRSFFTMVKHHRPDFGELPKKACFDIAADFKIRNNVCPPYSPYELTKKGYEDCMELMAHYACVSYCLCGSTEVCTLFLFFLSIQFLIPSLFVLAT